MPLILSRPYCIMSSYGAALLALGLVGCMPWPNPIRGELAVFPAPTLHDGGVEIARAAIVPGETASRTGIGQVADCYGPGLGVLVETARGADRVLFDTNGEPCQSANLLFDGTRPIDQRQPELGVQVRVLDGFDAVLAERPNVIGRVGSQADLKNTSQIIPQVKLNTTLTPVAAEGEDPVTATLNSWQQADNYRAAQNEQTNLANTRALNRLVNQATDRENGAAAVTLAAQLRAQERLLADESRRHQQTLTDSATNRAMTQAQRDAWQQEQDRLQSALAAAQSRAAQFEQMANRLQAEKTRKEAAMGERIATLSGSLKLAEQQADANRRDLILKAAAKVAQAQALATAAQLETQQDQLAEAARLHAQANELMDQVLTTRTRDETVEPKAGPVKPGSATPPGAEAVAELPLDQAPVILQAKERILPDILGEVLQQAAAHSGAWRAEWQLGDAGQALLAERWSLTAEATVGQILANLQAQVRQQYQLELAFTPFTQTKVLVITLKAPSAP
jgi:hypothetical protein